MQKKDPKKLKIENEKGDRAKEHREKRGVEEMTRSELIGKCVSCQLYNSKRTYVTLQKRNPRLSANLVICEPCVIAAGKALGYVSQHSANKAIEDKDSMFEDIKKLKKEIADLTSENKEILKKEFGKTLEDKEDK